jgi:hypothetical protein
VAALRRRVRQIAIGSLALLAFFACAICTVTGGNQPFQVGDNPLGEPDVLVSVPSPTPPPEPTAVPTPSEPPLIVLSAASAVQGAVVSVNGQGFTPWEEVAISLEADDGQRREVGRTAADKDGRFAGFNIGTSHEVAPGRYRVVAIGVVSQRRLSADLDLKPSGPWIALDPYAAKPGASVVVSGGGFQPSEPVRVHLDSLSAPALASLSADATGNVAPSNVTVPYAPPGDHSVVLVGERSGRTVASGFTITGFHPWIALSSYSPQPESTIGVAGQDFAPGEAVYLFLNNTPSPPVARVVADAHGTFEARDAIDLPVHLRGENRVIAVGQQTQQAVEATFTIMPFQPSLELTTYAGPVGTAVGFIGQGWARSETVRVQIGAGPNGREVSRFQAGPDGSFKGAGTFDVPPDVPTGTLTLTAVGDLSQARVAIAFEVLPPPAWAEPSTYEATIGGHVFFDGHQFAPGETVALYVGDDRRQPIAQAVADEAGDFHAVGPYVVPHSAGESLRFVLVGQHSNAEAEVVVRVLRVVGGAGEPTRAPTPAGE